jgi:hypothetical protein
MGNLGYENIGIKEIKNESATGTADKYRISNKASGSASSP